MNDIPQIGAFNICSADGGSSKPLPKKVAAVLLDGDSMILVVRQHKDGRVSAEPPGGAIDDGETAEQALYRELGEELGWFHSPKILRALGEVSPTHGFGKPTNYYLCKKLNGVAYNAAEQEHLGVIRVPIGFLDDMRESAIRQAGQILLNRGAKTDYPIDFRLPSEIYLNLFKTAQLLSPALEL